jgi:hypothetical protein
MSNGIRNRKKGLKPLPNAFLGSLQKFTLERIARKLYKKCYKESKNIDLSEEPLLYVQVLLSEKLIKI